MRVLVSVPFARLRILSGTSSPTVTSASITRNISENGGYSHELLSMKENQLFPGYSAANKACELLIRCACEYFRARRR
jgi:hypothetical protein